MILDLIWRIFFLSSFPMLGFSQSALPSQSISAKGHEWENGWNESDREALRDSVKRLWRQAEAVCFDMDDTVVAGDSNAEIALYLGFSAIAKATDRAMNSTLPLSLDIMKRFDRMRPSRGKLASFLESRTLNITPGAKELIKLLQRLGKDVYLLTSGFYQMAMPVAEHLDIPRENVFANSLFFDESGNYLGVETSVTKGERIDRLKREFGYGTVIMIGDGTNDLSACPPADAFIGFGGNKVHETVLAHAKWFVMDFKSLEEELR